MPSEIDNRRFSLRRVAFLLLGLFAFVAAVAIIDWLIMQLVIARSVPNPVYP